MSKDGHIITLGNDRHTVDPEQYVVDTLDAHWDQSNTDSSKPRILKSHESMGLDFQNQDYLVVYESGATTEPVTVTYQFTNSATTVSLDVYTKHDRAQLLRIIEEARRILLADRKDTYEAPGGQLTGRHWLTWGTSISPYSKTSTGYHRRVVDCEIRWRFRRIEAGDTS